MEKTILEIEKLLKLTNETLQEYTSDIQTSIQILDINKPIKNNEVTIQFMQAKNQKNKLIINSCLTAMSQHIENSKIKSC